MQSDRELLEAAARAAGFEVVGLVENFLVQPNYEHRGGFIVRNDKGGDSPWNPLGCDGDALRLAVKLQMIVDFSQDDGPLDVLPVIARGCVHDKADPYAATRRSIVMCAAAMGEKA